MSDNKKNIATQTLLLITQFQLFNTMINHRNHVALWSKFMDKNKKMFKNICKFQ